MGLKLFNGVAGGGGAAVTEGRRERFGAYFPRVFAYVQHTTGDEAVTREVVAETFARVLARPGEMPDSECRLALFRTARELCQERRALDGAEECLTSRERDILSLVFDGQLSREEVAAVLEMEEPAVTGEMVRALKKLRAGMGPASVPSFLRMS